MKKPRKEKNLDSLLDSIQKNIATSSKWQIDMLKKHRPSFFSDEKVEVKTPTRIKKQSELARFLQGYYEGKINIVINDQLLNAWRSGTRLKPVPIDGKSIFPPAFPPKNGQEFVVKECLEWMDKWIIPTHTPKSNGAAGVEIIDYAADSERMEWEEKKVRADAMKERYVLRADAENQSLADLQFLVGIFRKAGEIDSCKTRLDWVIQRWSIHLPAGEIELFRAMNDASERQRVDYVEAECQRMAELTPEQLLALAKELAEKLTGKIVK